MVLDMQVSDVILISCKEILLIPRALVNMEISTVM